MSWDRVYLVSMREYLNVRFDDVLHSCQKLSSGETVTKGLRTGSQKLLNPCKRRRSEAWKLPRRLAEFKGQRTLGYIPLASRYCHWKHCTTFHTFLRFDLSWPHNLIAPSYKVSFSLTVAISLTHLLYGAQTLHPKGDTMVKTALKSQKKKRKRWSGDTCLVDSYLST